MIFAVIQTGSKQYIVKPNDLIKVEKLSKGVGEEVVFEQVLLLSDSEAEDVKVGRPFVEGAQVKAKILKQDKYKKINVVKYKNKTRYKRKYGHRQPFTEVQIISIV